MVVIAGKIAVTERDHFDNHKPIVIHGQGNFLGELALLSGRPALVDAIAQDSVEVLIIPPERLRALMIAEAELGERIMRALILRRVAIVQAGIRRASHPWPCRERGRAAAGRFSPSQWSSPPTAQPRE